MTSWMIRLWLLVGVAAIYSVQIRAVDAAYSFAADPVSVTVAGFAVSAQKREQDDALEMMKRGEILSYSKIRDIVRTRIGGRLVGERLRHTNSGWVYEVRVRQKDGRVVFAIIDAKTGRILNRY